MFNTKNKYAIAYDKQGLDTLKETLEITKKSSNNEKLKINKNRLNLLILKSINYTNIKVLKYFLNKFGYTKSRVKTNLNKKAHSVITKSIRKAKNNNLIPKIIKFNLN